MSELERQTTEISVVTKEGKNGGTFAHELLAIEYAGWISSRLSTSISMLKRRWY
ncbi:KilA-N domain-containing protein [Klebsiella pneumoniae]|uniref:KilA-N domain-containing protein n=1 Tax=Klebsiella quasipneumoniae TaxID=1463165 RepID=UPI002FE02F75